MDKKSIAFLRKRFPGLFSRVVKNFSFAWLASELDIGQYLYCMWAKKPYFGTVFLAGQTWEERKPYMRRAVELEIKRKGKDHFNLLEIGSWVGDSAVLWANTIKSAGCSGVVVCVDAWKPYVREEDDLVNVAPVIMNRALKKGRIFKLFRHNIKTSGYENMIHAVKGKSEEILPSLPKDSFDLAYIDADHSYSVIKQDLKNAADLIADGGILCGDDFDLTVEQIDYEYAQKNKEINAVVDPKTHQVYHPGVCLAVSEFFGTDISSYNGFWIMRKAGSRWQKVDLN